MEKETGAAIGLQESIRASVDGGGATRLDEHAAGVQMNARGAGTQRKGPRNVEHAARRKGESLNAGITPRRGGARELQIEAGILMKLRTILDSASEAGKVKPLPAFKQKEMNNPGMTVYMLGTIPFTLLNDVVHQVTDTMKFRFQGHEVTIHSSEVFGTAHGLAIKLHLRGDVRAAVFLNGTVGFDTVKQNWLLITLPSI